MFWLFLSLLTYTFFCFFAILTVQRGIGVRINFWGVRGSIPTPLTPQQVQAKISAAVSRMTPNDAADAESKQRFLSSLPEWLYGTVGGNTACVEVRSKDDARFILDLGTGVRAMCKATKAPANLHYNVLLSHFHWDHLQGFPFFDQTYFPNATFDIYSTFPAAEKLLAAQSQLPYFPQNACWENLKARFTFHLVKEGQPFEVEGLKIVMHKMRHPGNSYSMSFEEDGKRFIYATDVELEQSDFDTSIPRNDFFRDADAMVIDSQYTAEEAMQKVNWGHSSFCNTVDFANAYGIKHLYMFHHEPMYDDKKVHSILQSARWYAEYEAHSPLKVDIAVEGQGFNL